MNHPRYRPTATLLPDGRVLVAGGADDNPCCLSSAEIYDPADGTWSDTTAMSSARWGHEATLLLDGRVLVTGGDHGGGLEASAEIYDPAPGAGTWSAAGSMTTGRAFHTATPLSDGRVLLTGGANESGFLASADIYTPTPGPGTWALANPMSTARYSHTATLLPDGRVLVTGGYDGSSMASSVEIYDPAMSLWALTSSMSTGRYGHTAALLPDGGVLVAGGQPDFYGFMASAEIFSEEPTGNEPPTAEAGANQSIHAGQTVQLDGSGSFDDTTPTQNLQFAWGFTSVPPGSATTFSDPNASNPAFVADLPGTYVVSLVVTDEGELPSNSDEVTISSQNAPPNAEAGPDQGTFVGNLVALIGSASNDPDFDLITFSWTLITQPAGSTATLSDAATATPTFVPDLPGSYVVALIVSDPFVASAPDAVTIAVITTGDFAEQQTVDAINTVGSLPPSSVTTKGNQTALENFLTQVTAALQVGDLSEAKKRLQDAIERTDGCALRGSPDPPGGGQIKQDYIMACTDQAPVYTLLKDALDALSGI